MYHVYLAKSPKHRCRGGISCGQLAVFCGMIVLSGIPVGADDDAIRQAIITSVKFEGAAEAHFKWDGDFWECVVRAVAQAAVKYPDFLETTYRDARKNLAYYMK